MFAKILSTIGFYSLVAVSLAISIPIIVLVYLPLVALKAIWQVATGRAKPRLSQRATPAV